MGENRQLIHPIYRRRDTSTPCILHLLLCKSQETVFRHTAIVIGRFNLSVFMSRPCRDALRCLRYSPHCVRCYSYLTPLGVIYRNPLYLFSFFVFIVPNSHLVVGNSLMVSLSFSIVCSVLKVISVRLRQLNVTFCCQNFAFQIMITSFQDYCNNRFHIFSRLLYFQDGFVWRKIDFP